MNIKPRINWKKKYETLVSDFNDLYDNCDVGRCKKCKRLGVPKGYICMFCGQDPCLPIEDK